MTEKVFVDSNVLIYAHDAEAGKKREISSEWLGMLWAENTGRLSTQVLSEFYYNITGKVRTPLKRALAREVVRQYGRWVEAPLTAQTILRASEIGEIARVSFWDSLILSAASEIGATEVLTEDMNNGQVIAGIRITNPFR